MGEFETVLSELFVQALCVLDADPTQQEKFVTLCHDWALYLDSIPELIAEALVRTSWKTVVTLFRVLFQTIGPLQLRVPYARIRGQIRDPALALLLKGGSDESWLGATDCLVGLFPSERELDYPFSLPEKILTPLIDQQEFDNRLEFVFLEVDPLWEAGRVRSLLPVC